MYLLLALGFLRADQLNSQILSENFESGIFPPAGWSVTSGGGVIMWAGGTISAYGIGNFTSFYPGWLWDGDLDEMISPVFAAASNDSLSFDHAYVPYYTGAMYLYSDLRIYYKLSGDTNWLLLTQISGNDLQTAPGTGGYFFPANSEWARYTIDLPDQTVRIKFSAQAFSSNNLFLDNITVGLPPPTKVLDLTLLLEGFYSSGSNTMVNDTVRVYMRKNIPPYSIVDSSRKYLNNNGRASFVFNKLALGAGYYIQVKHRNSVETWSKSSIMFDNFYKAYDFTTDSAKAYGDNMTKEGVRWTLYSGDVNQDGIIDGTDNTLIDNDAFNFLSGYLDTDLTGDDFVDATDFAIADNNANSFIGSIVP